VPVTLRTSDTPGLRLLATGVPVCSGLASTPPWQHARTRNFWDGSRVLCVKDEPPVEKPQAGASPASDFTRFMRNHQDMVYSTSLRILANAAQAENIAQEVFLRVWQHWSELAVNPRASGWVKAVATNLSLNHLQRYRRRWKFLSEFRREDSDEADLPPVEFSAPDRFFEGMDGADRRARIDAALANLPDHQRVPLVLFHFEELAYEEIARQLGISLSKVKVDIHRGRAALAGMLGQPEEGAP
jgi:RNA polymerase sigma-70 factor (ECF subfamily)